MTYDMSRALRVSLRYRVRRGQRSAGYCDLLVQL